MSPNWFSTLADNKSNTKEILTPTPLTPAIAYQQVGRTELIQLQTAESAASSHSLKTDNSHPSLEREKEDDKEEESERSTSEEEFQEVQEVLGQPAIESPTEEQSSKIELIDIDLPSLSIITHPNSRSFMSPTSSSWIQVDSSGIHWNPLEYLSKFSRENVNIPVEWNFL